MVDRDTFSFLSENEFKLFANIKAFKETKPEIAELPYKGDGFMDTEDRYDGYKNLKKHKLIHFDESKFKTGFILRYSDVTLL
ncbi:hypothetical protein [Paenisporosarcina sp. TG-14]|uniref:hypothetical protein n=1 Tax=Paenisporosarcina sp. TG-14 TaxID=1231057 RepID=UPI00030003DE|nr:hypothetical protein [Paenisporosarcina sp. TG-14]